MTTDRLKAPAEGLSGTPPHGTIGALYPGVARVMLFVAFAPADAEAEPNYQQIIFTRDSEAAFRLDYSRDDCAGGGFDFSPFVRELIAAGEARAHGQLACPGWLGGGEGSQRGLPAEYRIIVDYDN